MTAAEKILHYLDSEPGIEVTMNRIHERRAPDAASDPSIYTIRKLLTYQRISKGTCFQDYVCALAGHKWAHGPFDTRHCQRCDRSWPT